MRIKNSEKNPERNTIIAYLIFPMKSFIKFIVFCLLAYAYVILYVILSAFFFLYIKIEPNTVLGLLKGSTISSLWNNPYIDILYGLLLVLLSVFLILFFNDKSANSSIEEDKITRIFKEYFIVPGYIVMAILCFMLFIGWAYLIWGGLALLLYLEFSIRFFLEHSLIWMLLALLPILAVFKIYLDKETVGYKPNILYNGWLIWYIYKKNQAYFNQLRWILRFLILILISLGTVIIILFRPNTIYLFENKICIWKQCHLYTDIKAINIDYSGYRMEVILKPFDTKLFIYFSRRDMFQTEICDKDESGAWCEIIHKPIVDINDRLTFVVQEDEKSGSDEDRISSEELSYFSEQKNFEKTLNAVISWKIEYPETLNQDWIMVLKLLKEKTNLYPKVTDSK